MAPAFKQPIKLVGCGPASISCATFLGRLGYTDIEILERDEYHGGLSTSEIPAYRLPYAAVDWEVKQMENLGVKVRYNCSFGNDVTVPSLRKDGAKAIFLGLGMPNPTKSPVFAGLEGSHGFWTSKDFLPKVAAASKAGKLFWRSRTQRSLTFARHVFV